MSKYSNFSIIFISNFTFYNLKKQNLLFLKLNRWTNLQNAFIYNFIIIISNYNKFLFIL